MNLSVSELYNRVEGENGQPAAITIKTKAELQQLGISAKVADKIIKASEKDDSDTLLEKLLKDEVNTTTQDPEDNASEGGLMFRRADVANNPVRLTLRGLVTEVAVGRNSGQDIVSVAAEDGDEYTLYLDKKFFNGAKPDVDTFCKVVTEKRTKKHTFEATVEYFKGKGDLPQMFTRGGEPMARAYYNTDSSRFSWGGAISSTLISNSVKAGILAGIEKRSQRLQDEKAADSNVDAIKLEKAMAKIDELVVKGLLSPEAAEAKKSNIIDSYTASLF